MDTEGQGLRQSTPTAAVQSNTVDASNVVTSAANNVVGSNLPVGICPGVTAGNVRAWAGRGRSLRDIMSIEVPADCGISEKNINTFYAFVQNSSSSKQTEVTPVLSQGTENLFESEWIEGDSDG